MIDAPPPTAALVEQLGSADFNARALALAELVRRGRATAPALSAALDSGDPEVRLQALRALAEIADPASAASFARFLDAPDERMRAFAAQGLSRIGDSARALRACPRDRRLPGRAASPLYARGGRADRARTGGAARSRAPARRAQPLDARPRADRGSADRRGEPEARNLGGDSRQAWADQFERPSPNPGVGGRRSGHRRGALRGSEITPIAPPN